MNKKIIVAWFSCIITLPVFSQSGINAKRLTKPDPVIPTGWYSGDMHVHRNCGEGSIFITEDSLIKMMEVNNLNIISLLADMGNGEVHDSKADLLKITGRDAPQTTSNRILHWDTEWHWDATYSAFEHQAMGGHLVLLGLDHANQIWEESPYKILDWGKQQGAISGFAHLQYLADTIQTELNCCIPVDLPVEAALGTIDFVSEDVYSIITPKGGYNSEAAIHAYYKLLNCGFRLGLAAGTDFPCNDKEPLGTLLTYVHVNGKLTYKKWIDGIKKGNTVVSRAGNREFLDFTVNGKFQPGDNIAISEKKRLPIKIGWSSEKETIGTIELICNGNIVASKTGISKPGKPLILYASVSFTKSSWIAARRMDTSEHVSHTAPVFITKNKAPVRAGNTDVLYYIQWIDHLLQKIEPGSTWHHYFPNDFETVKARYLKAKEVYSKMLSESE
ncbi:MAG: hypothetical protein JWM28_1090 [Chitinophagaceae bacterium]|nr:hypothetical protein [Chitinophagaceae bacterium]